MTAVAGITVMTTVVADATVTGRTASVVMFPRSRRRFPMKARIPPP